MARFDPAALRVVAGCPGVVPGGRQSAVPLDAVEAHPSQQLNLLRDPLPVFGEHAAQSPPLFAMMPVVVGVAGAKGLTLSTKPGISTIVIGDKAASM